MRDIGNAGCVDVKFMFKSDQGASIVTLQHEIQRSRDAKTIPVNSPVGESECNGRVENAIKRVQIKYRTIKAMLEAKFGMKLTKLNLFCDKLRIHAFFIMISP